MERLHHGAVSPDSVTVDLRDDAAQHIDQLQETIRALSAASKSQPLVRLEKLLDLLSRLSPLRNEPLGDSEAHAAYVSDLCWLVAAKAVMQMLGSVMHIFLDRSLVLNEEIAYWADVQSSVWYTGLYTVQTSPAWLWAKLREECQEHGSGFERPISISLVSAQWERFYQRLRRCVQSRSMYDLRRGIPSFFSASKTEVRQKQKTLKAMKSRYTSSIGFLIQECLALWADGIPDSERLRKIVMKSTVMMDKIVLTTADSTPDFEEATFAAIEQETGSSRGQAHEDYSRTEPDAAIERLLDILRSRLPDSLTRSRTSIRIHGRPSHLTRYWIPLTFGFLTTNTFIKIWSSQRARLISWIMDIGSTTIQFWGNWVVEPVEKLVKTIRHDEGSEIALMSKNSLEADRASLERMVVDFVVDHDKSGGQATVATDVLASKVREGDLTPVLKAYERDLRTPFVGTVRGDLVRALLIQIQKTKVDVEVAMSGIDSLLKSQELVFGWVSSVFFRTELTVTASSA